MNAFLRSVETQRLKEHEARILGMRGDELPMLPSIDEKHDATVFEEEMAARRKQVAELRAKGRSQPQIAGLLGLSVRQVRHAARSK